jgi:hypothetical protein
MFYRVGVPLIIVLILALMLLALILWTRKRSRHLKDEARLHAEADWDGVCQFDNPETGAKCQREEFHLENHYREIQTPTGPYLSQW